MSKRIILVLVIITLAAFLLIAAGLPGLHLNPGLPFPSGNESGSVKTPIDVFPASDLPLLLLQGGFALAFILLLVYLGFNLLTSQGRKKLLGNLAALALIFFIISFIHNFAGNSAGGPPEEVIDQIGTPAAYATAPLGSPPDWLVLLVYLGFGLLLLAAGLWAFSIINRKKQTLSVQDRLLQEAQDAMAAIQSGQDLKSIIIRCYLQMSKALQEERDLERDQAMTAREFERMLGEHGVPPGPVHQLTRLFEEVRYGNKLPGNADEQTALSSLHAIIEYCQLERTVPQH